MSKKRFIVILLYLFLFFPTSLFQLASAMLLGDHYNDKGQVAINDELTIKLFNSFCIKVQQFTLEDTEKEVELIDLIEIYIPKILPINATDNKGRTLLHYAAENYCYLVGAVLINNGIDVNRQDSDGCTALHLLAKKTLPNLTTIDKIMPYSSEIIERYTSDTFSIPLSRHRPPRTIKNTISPKMLLKFALENSAIQKDMSLNEPFKEKCFIYKCNLKKKISDRIKLSNLLLFKEANLYLRNKQGETALDYAIANGSKELMNSMLKKHMPIHHCAEEDFEAEVFGKSPPQNVSPSPLSSSLNKS